ncbi:MAG TPA: helix-turn-helix domain-containing protein, partial [Gemmatimonadales bacterium]|nr:helix-turn-helix domain-containing protein [Gemmatimonadales bacterium]
MRPYDERLDHLLARAARVFADKGYHPTTMRDLSAASGMSLAGMYYYVRGKEDLLALIQERCFAQ